MGEPAGVTDAQALGELSSAVAGMLAGLALIAAPIVPRESSHQLLRVLNLDVVEEVLSFGAAQHCGLGVAVGDDHLAAAHEITESLRPRHPHSL